MRLSGLEFFFCVIRLMVVWRAKQKDGRRRKSSETWVKNSDENSSPCTQAFFFLLCNRDALSIRVTSSFTGSNFRSEVRFSSWFSSSTYAHTETLWLSVWQCALG